ncbi:MAG: ArsR/SmtB family transcription factor [Terriglobales bacterium]
MQRREQVFRAVADPTRREILRLLRGEERTVGAITAEFRTSRPAISRHLRKLRAAGLVRCERRGAERVCRLNPEPLLAIEEWLSEYRSFWQVSLRALKRYAEEKERCAEKKP